MATEQIELLRQRDKSAVTLPKFENFEVVTIESTVTLPEIEKVEAVTIKRMSAKEIIKQAGAASTQSRQSKGQDFGRRSVESFPFR